MGKSIEKNIRKICPECNTIFYVSEKNKKKVYCKIKCTNKHHNRLKCETLKGRDVMAKANPRENTRAAVLRVLTENYPMVKNHIVEHAHHKSKASGKSRLRELRLDGIVSYTFDKKSNTYQIKTAKSKLEKAYREELKRRDNALKNGN